MTDNLFGTLFGSIRKKEQKPKWSPFVYIFCNLGFQWNWCQWKGRRGPTHICLEPQLIDLVLFRIFLRFFQTFGSCVKVSTKTLMCVWCVWCSYCSFIFWNQAELLLFSLCVSQLITWVWTGAPIRAEHHSWIWSYHQDSFKNSVLPYPLDHLFPSRQIMFKFQPAPIPTAVLVELEKLKFPM